MNFSDYSYVWACTFWNFNRVRVTHSHPNLSIHPYRTCVCVIGKGLYEPKHICPFHIQELYIKKQDSFRINRVYNFFQTISTILRPSISMEDIFILVWREPSVSLPYTRVFCVVCERQDFIGIEGDYSFQTIWINVSTMHNGFCIYS